MHGTMVFAKALLCLGRCLMATQHALSEYEIKMVKKHIYTLKTPHVVFPPDSFLSLVICRPSEVNGMGQCFFYLLTLTLTYDLDL